jgi:hypothetical protein
VEFAVAIQRIWQERRWLVPVAVVAAFTALIVAYQVRLFPPGLESRSHATGAGSTHLLVDSSRSSLPDLAIPVEALGGRAQVYAELLRTEAVRQRIGDAVGVPWTSVFVDGSTTDPALDSEPQPSAEERGVELQSDEQDQRVFFRVEPTQPIIHISTEGPTAEDAIALARASALALSGYIGELQQKDAVPGPRRVELTQLGDAEGGTVNDSAGKTVALLAGAAVFGAGCLLILFIPRFRESVRSANALEGKDLSPSRPRPLPATLLGVGRSGSSLPERPTAKTAKGAKPRTTASGSKSDGAEGVEPKPVAVGLAPDGANGGPSDAASGQSDGERPDGGRKSPTRAAAARRRDGAKQGKPKAATAARRRAGAKGVKTKAPAARSKSVGAKKVKPKAAAAESTPDSTTGVMPKAAAAESTPDGANGGPADAAAGQSDGGRPDGGRKSPTRAAAGRLSDPPDD